MEGLCRAVGRSFVGSGHLRRNLKGQVCKAPELYEGSTAQAVVRTSVRARSSVSGPSTYDGPQGGAKGWSRIKQDRKALPIDSGVSGQSLVDLIDNRADFLRFLLRKLSHGKL